MFGHWTAIDKLISSLAQFKSSASKYSLNRYAVFEALEEWSRNNNNIAIEVLRFLSLSFKCLFNSLVYWRISLYAQNSCWHDLMPILLKRKSVRHCYTKKLGNLYLTNSLDYAKIRSKMCPTCLNSSKSLIRTLKNSRTITYVKLFKTL